MSLTLTFTGKDILNDTICLPGGRPAYTLHTTKGVRGRKVTTVTGSPTAFINWRKRYLEIGSQMLPIDAVKRRAGGWLARKRMWLWGETGYELHYSRQQWSAKNPSGAVVARFSPYRMRIFRKSDPAQIVFLYDFPPAEAAFLVLVFIYSEIRRQDKQRASSAASAGAASSAGGGGGGC
ncbi:hypothetical protein BD626DRAFT_508762 [Schizophyllum amplum]|uniref:Tubby C-terminal-like domain-containing protein n=1 Tax=Schizophyllum amplum TaxID=97359 RepID=A0A550C3H8_9AGAR|nr:hypothetical protein BD626DRAFT_508762 [Auriculariopsis ampla]